MAATDKLTGQLGRANALHLLRRTTFGFTVTDVDRFATYTVDQAMNELFTEPAPVDQPIDLLTGETWLKPAATEANSESNLLHNYFMMWHLEKMRQSGTCIKERLTWFYHSHLPVSREVVNSSEKIYYQNALFRHYAFGSFKELFKRICMDNAMLNYLDNDTNDVSSPNENFAREMFELYSIGRGEQVAEGDYTNYTEDDIKAATRVLTGYTTDTTYLTLDAETMLPTGKLRTTTKDGRQVAHRHDAGEKQFSARFANKRIVPSELVGGLATVEAVQQEFDEMMDMIFDQDETARFITRKLYRQMVYYKIDDSVETNVIRPVASLFKAADYDVPTLVKTLLSSQHFYDADDATAGNDVRGSLIKSPMELMFGALNLFEVQLPQTYQELYNTVYDKGILSFIEDQGLNLYAPFEVAGYPAYHQFPAFTRNWITPTTLAYRYKFAEYMLNGVNDGGAPLAIKADVLGWIETSGAIANPGNAAELVGTLLELMVPFGLAPEREDFFLTKVFLDDLYASAWTEEWNNYLTNPTAYKATVESRLNLLVNAIMQSPEYQLG